MSTFTAPRFEAKDPRFEPEDAPPAVPPPKASAWRACLVGCLVFAVLAVVLVLAAGFWVWRNWRDLAATGATEAIDQMVETMDLPADERREMRAEVERVADAFRDGRLTQQQMGRIVQELVHSPLLSLFVASAVEKQYLEKSGLSAEEKMEGRRELRRFVRGAIDHKINQAAIDAVLKHIGKKQPDGKWQLRERVSDAELRAALAEAKRVADEAGIPEEPEEVDASAEFRRIVDEAMKK
jgi:hypothetical protein